jgi:MFS family permease
LAEAVVQQRPNGLVTNPWYVVFVLVAAAILSYLDRGVVNILVPDLRRSLGLTEVQVSVIQGFAFSLFFALGGLLIGALTDRLNRKLIVICGVLGWSAMTVLCGLAQNFEQLFAARAGVGIGEACLSPAAYSVICDLFSPERRGRPMSFMTMAASIGGAASSLLGGLILKLLGGSGNVWVPLLGMIEAWRVTFILVGAPGVLMTLLVLTIREPARSTLANDEAHGDSYTQFILRNWRVFVPLKLMIALTFSISYVVTAWVPTALIRSFGFSAANAGITLGLSMVPSSALGALAGGVLGDWMAQRGRPYGRLRAWLGGTTPVLAGAGLMAWGSEHMFLVGMLMVLITGGVFASLSYPALYDVTPRQFRGRAISVVLLLASVVGMGGSITTVAILTEHVFHDDMMVRTSMAIVAAAVGAIAPLLVLLQLKPYEQMRLRNVSPAIQPVD